MMLNVFDLTHRVRNSNRYLKVNAYLNFGKIHGLNLTLPIIQLQEWF